MEGAHTPTGNSARSDSSPPVPQWRRWFVYSAWFILVFAGFEYGYQLARGTVIERIFADRLTVAPAAFLVARLLPDIHVLAIGHSLVSFVGSINVLSGCDGMDAMFMLVAAIAPFPASRLSKLVGAGLGVLLLYALNQARLLAFFLALRFQPDLFEPLHGLVGPTLLIVSGGLFFLFWMSAAASQSHA